MKHLWLYTSPFVGQLMQILWKSGSAWKRLYFVPSNPKDAFFFFGTRIGVQVPHRKACSDALLQTGNEAVVLSLPFPAAAALYQYNVCALTV